MRIAQPLSFITKRIAATIAKRTTLVSFGFIILAGGVIAGQNLLTTPDSASAATPPDSCFAFNAGTGTITDYYNNEANNAANPACPRAVDIPATIGGVSVVSVGNSAFYNNQLTTVTIPSSVTSIGSNAFSHNQLTTVTIPSSVTSIGSYAFSYNQLTTVTILNPAASMQHNIFANNPISSMTIGSTTYTEQSPTTDPICFARTGSTVTDYYQASPIVARDSGVLCGRDVVVPVDITSIGNYAFESNQLTTVTIPGGVTSIGGSAFSNNQLTSVTIPSSVTSIGDSAFSTNQLTTVTIPSSVTSIGSYAFYSNQLTTVAIPSSVTSIDNDAFALQSQYGRDLDWCENDAPCLWSDDPLEVQAAYDSIWYARLYTEDPTNPHNLTDSITYEDWWIGEDANANGLNDSLGGHLINPSSTELRSLDRSGTAIGTPQTITGMLNGSPLTNYLVTQGPLVPNIADSSSPTPAEQAALDQALSAYHRAGSTQTFTPQAIPGYITPAPQTKTLVAGDNTLDFTYNRPVLSVPFVSNDVTDGVLVPSTTPGSVASPLLSESKLSIANDNTCSTIQSAELLAPGSVTAPQDITILGGLGFTLDCTTAATTTVSLTLGSQANSGALRAYKDNGGVLTDITSQVILTNVNGKTVITYNLTDGGSMDEDNTANGTIVDPIYIGVTGDGELAATGTSMQVLASISMVAIVVGLISVIYLRRSY